MPQEPDSAEGVLSALERTLSRGSARIEFRYDWELDEDWPGADSPAPSAAKGRDRVKRELGRHAWRLLWWGIRRFLQRTTRKLPAQRAVGVLDFGAHRCMCDVDGGSKVQLVVGDQLWKGPAGTTIDARSAERATHIQPLWLFDLARGTVSAQEAGEDVIDGHPCRRYTATADLTRAAGAVPHEMALPPQGLNQLGDLKRLALELWVDGDGLLRRIRREEDSVGMNAAATLDLSEFGTRLPSDWSRLQRITGGG